MNESFEVMWNNTVIKYSNYDEAMTSSKYITKDAPEPKNKAILVRHVQRDESASRVYVQTVEWFMDDIWIVKDIM